MTGEKYINENKTPTFKKGDKVIMYNCGESSFYKGKVWICKTDSFRDKSGSDVVFLEGYSGYFCCRFLKKSGMTEEEFDTYINGVIQDEIEEEIRTGKTIVVNCKECNEQQFISPKYEFQCKWCGFDKYQQNS